MSFPELVIYTVKHYADVPEPNREFLPSSNQAEAQIVEGYMTGDHTSFTSVVILGMRTPWWSATRAVKIKHHLTWEQQALFDRFTCLPTSQECRAAFVDWEERVNEYIELKRSNADAKEIQAAFLEAQEAMEAVHSKLWIAIEALRWSP